MSRTSLSAGIVGIPLLIPLFLVGCLTPRYVPSDAIRDAAASTSSPELARQRIVGSFVRRCRRDWSFDALGLDGTTKLRSWESDAGLLATTVIVCVPGGQCTTTADAMIAWPFPSRLGGKRVPTRIWGCGAGQ